MTTDSSHHRESGRCVAASASSSSGRLLFRLAQSVVVPCCCLLLLSSSNKCCTEAYHPSVVVAPSARRCRSFDARRVGVPRRGGVGLVGAAAWGRSTGGALQASPVGGGFGNVVEEVVPPPPAAARRTEEQSSTSSPPQVAPVPEQGSDDNDNNNIPTEILSLPPDEIKKRLVELLPRMTGTKEEFRLVESYINALEERYTPVQTLPFLNLAMGGTWQLLFSTNRLGMPNPRLRLRELVQVIETQNLGGTVTNMARWDLAEDGNEFDATGTFSVECSYRINQGARMVMDLDDHVLKPSRGSKIPRDVPALVGMLHGAMPAELFDPSELAMDTTYLDGDLRIVRLTGSRLEGVRNVFVRSGAVEFNAPTTKKEG